MRIWRLAQSYALNRSVLQDPPPDKKLLVPFFREGRCPYSEQNAWNVEKGRDNG